ncbi:transposase [uncultured Roseobacter sp.]|uniref:transposase n=1 Tax=uncultured Roseobacter sp. TaxID=114847 RepID=UPI003455BBA6
MRQSAVRPPTLLPGSRHTHRHARWRRLAQVPGVGPIVALSSIAAIDDAIRFRLRGGCPCVTWFNAGPCQSGEIDCSGRIFPHGDCSMRKLLHDAATMLIRYVTLSARQRVGQCGLDNAVGSKRRRSRHRPRPRSS